MRGEELIKQARQKPILADGAMGTMLLNKGLPPGTCPELWNVEHFDIIYSIHAAYVEAGSQLISTNTFGANRLKLELFGLQDRVQELNKLGIQAAREAAGDKVFVAGSIGPSGKFLEPLGDLTAEEATDVFAEQAIAMAEAGADVILMETFADLTELKAALNGSLKSGLPCFCTMPFDTNGRTMMGVSPQDAAVVLTGVGAAGVGANCGVGPEETLDIIKQIRETTNAIVIAQPNAGAPRIVGGVAVYDSTPEEMASFAKEAARIGVNIIGACCGSTPEHIWAMAKALELV
ncbi:MAG: homocysteine S-methyltransferase family protein [Armatimonadota bacterium]|nr:homocysteine S-methyltransferase family protein [Armatimonadota bacterium]